MSTVIYIPEDATAIKFGEAAAGGLSTMMPTVGLKIIGGRQLPRNAVLSLCFIAVEH